MTSLAPSPASDEAGSKAVLAGACGVCDEGLYGVCSLAVNACCSWPLMARSCVGGEAREAERRVTRRTSRAVAWRRWRACALPHPWTMLE